jgi:hypothetical protein
VITTASGSWTPGYRMGLRERAGAAGCELWE